MMLQRRSLLAASQRQCVFLHLVTQGFVLRATWIYKDSAWRILLTSEVLGFKAKRLRDSPIVSVTAVQRPEDDPLVESDSEREEEEGREISQEARLCAETDSIYHKLCHRPKSPYCKICQKTKMYSPQARKKLRGFINHQQH